MIEKNKKYNAQEFIAKGKEALNNLKENKNPGEVSGEITKMEVLFALKEDIKNRINEGYTIPQIADSFKENGMFDVLPRYITKVISDRKIARSKVKKTVKSTPEQDMNINKADGNPEKKQVQLDTEVAEKGAEKNADAPFDAKTELSGKGRVFK